MRILSGFDFQQQSEVWRLPAQDGLAEIEITGNGWAVAPGEGREVTIGGAGMHTRNGDSILLNFSLSDERTGSLIFGFSGGMEFAIAKLDFGSSCISLTTSDWTEPQPVCSSHFKLSNNDTHILRIDKSEGKGKLVKYSNLKIYLDEEILLSQEDLNVLPEMGVTIGVKDARILLRSFIHKGKPNGMPEHLNVGGWQIVNGMSVERNLESLFRGLSKAAEAGVQLLVTPETSLTGLMPGDPESRDPAVVSDAEIKLRQFIRGLKDAPYLVAGLPLWEKVPGHKADKTSFNASRVYDPDGEIVATCPKIHSCEKNFWHGYKLHVFNIYGVPVTMHICHDARYPELWTLPVMFGARLVLRPANDGFIEESVDAFETIAKSAPDTTHAFHLDVNGYGRSFLTGPAGGNGSLIAVSPECRRDNPSFPMIGRPMEGLFHARIRVDDAFGYWPVRSFRASENTAEAYLALYRSMGGHLR